MGDDSVPTDKKVERKASADRLFSSLIISVALTYFEEESEKSSI
jgi:hypothetical protein